MATTKTSTPAFRIEPALKEALRTTAQQEHQSIANMVGVLIRDYCGRNNISIEDHGNLSSANQKLATGKKKHVGSL